MARPLKDRPTSKLQARREYFCWTRKKVQEFTGINPITHIQEHNGINPETLKCWEYGYRNPPLTKLKMLAKLYKCKIDDLVD